MPFVAEAARGAARVVLCGGVALNSVLNGKLEASLDAAVHVPCAPGDEGVALGCADRALALAGGPRLTTAALPYAGVPFTARDVDDAVAAYADRLDAVATLDVVAAAADALERGGVVFWYEGAPEFGPRALGHRSIVALATRGAAVDDINARVKGREDFRPLAPAVLEEEAARWFEGTASPSPSMSRVWTLTRDAAAVVEACAHVDRSARPQTVGAADGRVAGYRALIDEIFRRTGVPFVLNTSFNTKPGEPIVDSPAGAVSSFLHAASRAGGLKDALLVLEGRVFRAARCPIAPDGNFPGAATAKPDRRHAVWTLAQATGPSGDAPPVLTVEDLDEPLETSTRGTVELEDALDFALYERCDGATAAADLAADLADEAGHDVSAADVHARLARLWRRGLVRL